MYVMMKQQSHTNPSANYFQMALLWCKGMIPYMWYGCGADVAVVMAKLGNTDNMNIWFLSFGAAAERHTMALWSFFLLHGVNCATASAAESGHGQHSHDCFFSSSWTPINNYRSFQDAGNHDEGQLGKTELKLQLLYEVVIGAMFKPLFCASKSRAFLWIFSIFSPVGHIKPEPLLTDLAPWLFFSE